MARDEGRSLLREKLREVMSRHRLQAIVYPTQTMPIDRIGSQPRRNARGMFGNFGPVLASLAGWPELTIPAGLTPEGLPVGMSILGTESSEQRLLDLGEAFERSQKRRYPESTPSLAGEKFSY